MAYLVEYSVAGEDQLEIWRRQKLQLRAACAHEPHNS